MTELNKITYTKEHPAYGLYQTALQSGEVPRARELAKTLKITEGDLVACRQGVDSWAILPPFQTLLAELHSVGEVMTITRNDAAVHETTGTYHKFSFMERSGMGLVLSDDIDLRLFIHQWQNAFHVIENGRQSIQFFNTYGVAVHKVYQTNHTDTQNWDDLIARFRDPTPTIPHFLKEQEKEPVQIPESFDQAQFAQEWSNLKDVHAYHGMLKKHGLSRTQALSQIGEQWALPLDTDCVMQALTFAQQEDCNIMVFVGNGDCIQIFSGAVKRLMATEGWFNVLDPSFNLHLRVDSITQAWAIKRPSSDGIITSIEAFNEAGESIITLFGKRKPGNPELSLWQEIVQKVTDKPRPSIQPKHAEKALEEGC